jgi:peptide deformylase
MKAILQLGDPRLRLTSAPVTETDSFLRQELQELANALQSFRDQYHWGRAIAMPQIGIAKRALAFDLGAGPFVALNPKLEWISPEKFELWDDCMCMPSIAVRVERARSVSFSFFDEHMHRKFFDQVPPALAELIQHEMDHLEGIVFTDRMIHKGGVIARELLG